MRFIFALFWVWAFACISLSALAQPAPSSFTGSSGTSGVASLCGTSSFDYPSRVITIHIESPGNAPLFRLQVGLDPSGNNGFTTANGIPSQYHCLNFAVDLSTIGWGGSPQYGVYIYANHIASPNFYSINIQIDLNQVQGSPNLMLLGDNYYYSARCSTGSGSSLYSTPYFFTLPLKEPTSISISTSPGQASFSWTPPTPPTPNVINATRVQVFTQSNWNLCSGLTTGQVFNQNWGQNMNSHSMSLSPGTYWLSIRQASAQANGVFSQPIQFTVPAPCNLSASLAVTNTATCGLSNGVATATVSGGTAPFTYLFSNGESGGNTAYILQGNQNISVSITDANGCTTSASIFMPNNGSIPSVMFTPNINNLDVTFVNGSSAGSSSWDFGDGSTSGSNNPSHSYASDGNYTVKLTVTTPEGCSDSYSEDITVAMGVQSEDCTNGVDDDGDGDIDQADSDCPMILENCTNGVDDDLDGDIDASDSDCPPLSANEICSDGIDNDLDGLIDLADSDCQTTNCTPLQISITNDLGQVVLPHPVFANSFDNSLTVDESGNGNVCIVGGTPTIVPGIIGNGVKFRGVNAPNYMYDPDRIKISNSASLAFTNQMSLSYWIKIDGNQIMTFANCSGTKVSGIMGTPFAKDGDRNGLYFYESETGTSGNNIPWNGGTGVSVNNLPSVFNNYRHVVYVINGNQTSVYVNGVLATTATTTMNNFTYANQRDAYIGTTYNGAPYLLGGACLPYWGQLDGVVDELKVFNVALTPAQAQVLYSNAASAICANTPVQLTASQGNGYTYLWSTGQTTQMVSVTPNLTTSYQVTVTNANGCSGSASHTIDVLPSLNPTFSTSVSGLNVMFQSNLSDSQASWNFGDGSQALNGNANPTYAFSSFGTYTVTLTSTNANGCIETHEETITLAPPCHYYLSKIDNLPCYTTAFCIPIKTSTAVRPGLIGFDFHLEYDPALFTPTGLATLGNVILDGDPNASYYLNISISGHIYGTVYYEASASPTAQFQGLGDIICIEFMLNNPVAGGQTTSIVLTDVLESDDTSSNFECTDDTNNHGLITFVSSTIAPVKVQHTSGEALVYDVANPTAFNLTNVLPADASCNILGTGVATDLYGIAQVSTAVNATDMIIDREIDDLLPVISVINGADALLAQQIATLFNTTPGIFAYLAADVNGDGRVTGADITLILRRSVLLIGHFPNNIKDWVFVSNDLIQTPAFINADRWNVPSVPECLPLNLIQHGQDCIEADTTTAIGFMPGDVNQSWTSTIAPLLRTPALMSIDLSKVVVENGVYKIPVFVKNVPVVNSLSFQLPIYRQLLGIESSPAEANANQLTNNDVLVASYSSNGILENEAVLWLKFSDMPKTNDFGGSLLFGEINSQPMGVEIIDGNFNHTVLSSPDEIEIYPNPINDVIIVKGLENFKDSLIQLYSIDGKKIDIVISADGIIDASKLSSGSYILSINEKNYKLVKI